MRNWFNWTLVIAGIIMVIVEVLLGGFSGFDFALVGISLAAGGGIGLYFESAKVGLFASGALAFLYLAFFRRYIRSKLTATDRLSNVDAIVGRTGIVTARIAAHEPGEIKVGDEVWRAALSQRASGARELGETVTVESVDGVTMNVR